MRGSWGAKKGLPVRSVEKRTLSVGVAYERASKLCPSMNQHLLRSVLPLFFMALMAQVLGQDKFTVHGRLKIEGGDLSGARAVVYKNGEKERTITTGLNKFTLD